MVWIFTFSRFRGHLALGSTRHVVASCRKCIMKMSSDVVLHDEAAMATVIPMSRDYAWSEDKGDKKCAEQQYKIMRLKRKMKSMQFCS